jgi:hypothetical protein
MNAGAGARFDEQLTAMRADRDAAFRKLQEIRTAPESAWRGMQTGVDAAWVSMKNSLDQARLTQKRR